RGVLGARRAAGRGAAGTPLPWVSPGLPGYGVTAATISADSAAPEPRASSSPGCAVGLPGSPPEGAVPPDPPVSFCVSCLEPLVGSGEDEASQDPLLARAGRRPARHA